MRGSSLGVTFLTFVVLACGGTTKDPPGSSSGGAQSSAGPQSSAGAQSSQGGTASGNAGAAGSPTNGGASGGSVSVAGGVECASNEDCVRFEDCCSCSAEPAANPPAHCKSACEQSACVTSGLAGVDAVCLGNRCVLNLSCVRSEVTCRAAEPECDAGKVPSVIDGCWGPCVAPSQCFNVDNCADCAEGEVCVEQRDSFPLTQCVEVSSACAQKPTCECVDACFAQCSEENGVSCYCINC
jgi:hypothetical protein